MAKRDRATEFNLLKGTCSTPCEKRDLYARVKVKHNAVLHVTVDVTSFIFTSETGAFSEWLAPTYWSR